ncbi:hypothetical protein GCM10010404_74810 [Nonomuraea africana]
MPPPSTTTSSSAPPEAVTTTFLFGFTFELPSAGLILMAGAGEADAEAVPDPPAAAGPPVAAEPLEHDAVSAAATMTAAPATGLLQAGVTLNTDLSPRAAKRTQKP